MNIQMIVLMEILVGVSIVFCKIPSENRSLDRPCGRLISNFESCQCQDGTVYVSQSELRTNCGMIYDNPISSCTCNDGSTWTAGGTTPIDTPKEKPCNNWKNVKLCTCLNGESYEKKKDLKRNCKENENPITSCECKDGNSWE